MWLREICQAEDTREEVIQFSDGIFNPCKQLRDAPCVGNLEFLNFPFEVVNIELKRVERVANSMDNAFDHVFYGYELFSSSHRKNISRARVESKSVVPSRPLQSFSGWTYHKQLG